MRHLAILCCLFLFLMSSASVFAQGDTLGRYGPGFKFKDGLYLSFEDFKGNCPAIALADLQDRYGNSINAIEENVTLYHTVNDTLRYIDAEQLFGYSNLGKVSLGYKGNFDRLIVIGTLCHLVQREIVVDYDRGGLYDFNSMPVRREVQREFILDMRTGEMSPLTSSNLDYHIADDSTIASDYTEKSVRQRKATVYSTLHAYNRAHPVYFSISRCK